MIKPYKEPKYDCSKRCAILDAIEKYVPPVSNGRMFSGKAPITRTMQDRKQRRHNKIEVE